MLNPRARINLREISFLIADDNPQSLEIMCQVVSGFGAKSILRCANAAEARDQLKRGVVDFVITDAQMPGETGFELIEWLRRQGGDPNRFAPAVVVTAHTEESWVARARDSGANFLVAKPIAPQILLDRICWVAREQRMFIETGAYCGPDRRFKRSGPPPGMEGRRSDDCDSTELGDSGPDMSQDLIDTMVKPQKVSI
jgi:CheY-like chemotaxis protein